MSDMEESDLENVAFTKRKNGYTYYGKANNSPLKFMVTLCVISITFLFIGAVAGYYYGFDQYLFQNGFDANGDTSDIPKIQMPPMGSDPFKPFWRNGKRYGGDYGYDTIHHPVSGSVGGRHLLDGEEEEHDAHLIRLCANRRCCHPTNGVSEEDGRQCWGLTLDQCCELEVTDICDWNCDIWTPNVRKDREVRDGRHRNKVCYGHDDGKQGKFPGDKAPDDGAPDHGPPKDADDLRNKDDLLLADQCGDIWEDMLDPDDAIYEFLHNGDRKDEINGPDVETRRRLGIIGSDSREVQTQETWPQSMSGLILFTTSGGTSMCSGTKVSARHVITAGHCCYGGGWYSNWKWYPGVAHASQVTDSNAHTVSWAFTFAAWAYHQNYDYDMCVLTLSSPVYGWFGYGYNTGITNTWSFDLWGYPGDKYGNGHDLIKYGDSDCTQTGAQSLTITTNQFRYTCDTTGGMSGTGLYVDSTFIVYCIHSHTNGYDNGCARMTADKFHAIYDWMVSQDGWSL